MMVMQSRNKYIAVIFTEYKYMVRMMVIYFFEHLGLFLFPFSNLFVCDHTCDILVSYSRYTLVMVYRGLLLGAESSKETNSINVVYWYRRNPAYRRLGGVS